MSIKYGKYWLHGMQIENMAPSPSEKREMSKKRENINRLNVIEEKVINESHSVHLSAPGSSVTWLHLLQPRN